MLDHVQLLDDLKVKRIYWVDDQNASTQDLGIDQLVNKLSKRLTQECVDDVDACIRTFKDLAPRVTRPAGRKIGEARTKKDEFDPEPVIKEALEAMLADLPEAIDPLGLLKEALSALPNGFTDEEKSSLAEAFKDKGDWEWSPISFTDWGRKHRDILSDHNTPENTALLIVDLQNDRENTSVDGGTVLADWANWVTSSDSMKTVFAIAFTDKFSPQDEIKAGRSFTNELFTKPAKQQLPVLVLSKSRLKAPGGPAAQVQDAFKKALGRLRACLLHWDLATDLEGLFASSVADAFKDLQELSIEELLMGVSGLHTLKEGASDVDTLIRLAAIAQRGALLTRISSNANTAKILVELRGLAEVFTDYGSNDLATRAGIARLRASEVHDPHNVVNGLLSPLSTGDVFEIKRYGVDEYYMLASNICDLTLRGTTGRRKLDSGLLLRIEEAGRHNDVDAKPYRILPMFPETSPLASKRWQVEFNQLITVPLEILDLAWTNVEGKCAWSELMPLPLHLAPSQQLRFVTLRERFATAESRERLSAALPGIEMTAEQSTADARQLAKIEFTARRIGRISQQYATAVSEGFGQNISRPSFDHDMSGG